MFLSTLPFRRFSKLSLPCSRIKHVNNRHQLITLYSGIKTDDKYATTTSSIKFEKALPFADIPGPRLHWIFRIPQIFLAPGGPFKIFYKLQEEMIRDYGPLIKVPGANGVEVWVADPNDVATVFRADPKYPKRFNAPVLDHFREKYRKPAGVFFADGPEWHKHRSVLSKRMLRPPEMNKYIPRLNDIASDAVLCMKKHRNSPSGNMAFEIDHLDMMLFRWSFESVTDVLFDRRFGALSDNPSKESLDFIFHIGNFLKNVIPVSLFPLRFFKVYETKAFKEFNKSFAKLYYYANIFIKDKLQEIDERIKANVLNIEKDDIEEFIPFVLSSGTISAEDVESSIIDTLFAGVDTTSNTMQWVLYLLSKNQDVQECLRMEIDSVLGQRGIPDAESLSKIPLLKAVIKETLRLYPILIITERLLQEDVVLSGYHVPAGSQILIMNQVMGVREELFPNVKSFSPNRWLRGENQCNNAFSSLPFGFGTRMCLGRRLAELELQLLLVRIMQNFKLEYPPNEIVERYLRGTTIPDRPLRVKFIDRKGT